MALIETLESGKGFGFTTLNQLLMGSLKVPTEILSGLNVVSLLTFNGWGTLSLLRKGQKAFC